jgi:nucleoside-diphosphate-sugar epimerase
MLRHQNPSPKLPTRVVVMGAAGFVGSALVKTLAARGGSVLTLTRRDIDLLAPDAQDKLASMLRPAVTRCRCGKSRSRLRPFFHNFHRASDALFRAAHLHERTDCLYGRTLAPYDLAHIGGMEA